RLVRVLRRGGIGAGAGDLGCGDVDLARHAGDAVVGLADGVGVEGVGGKQIGAGLDVVGADLAHDLGAREVEQVVVALLVVLERAAAAVARLIEAIGLDGGAVGAVLDQDAVVGDLAQLVGFFSARHG